MEQRNIRVLINEAAAVVDLVVDDHVQVLLGVVARDLLEGEFLVGHDGEICNAVAQVSQLDLDHGVQMTVREGGSERERSPSEATKCR